MEKPIWKEYILPHGRDDIAGTLDKFLGEIGIAGLDLSEQSREISEKTTPNPNEALAAYFRYGFYGDCIELALYRTGYRIDKENKVVYDNHTSCGFFSISLKKGEKPVVSPTERGGKTIKWSPK